MKINFETVLDKINEYNDAMREYYHAGAIYRAKHGHGAYFDLSAGMDPETIDLWYKNRNYYNALDVLFGVYEITGLSQDPDAVKRADHAARALRKWYERGAWQFCPPAALIENLAAYVDGRQ